MKLLRVELRNFRGVDERSIEFSPEGITIVEGPNEIGKSSIAEGMDLALEELDSTAKRKVVDTRPVGKDVGPEVIIDIETGPYAFHYRKRFLRGALTELHVQRPRPEDLTGREAHDRVRSILAETVDVSLWKALRIQQGSAVDQPSLADQSSLSAALDRAAGEVPAGEEEQSLFEFAHDEYLGYWTETGRRKRESKELEQSVEEAKARISALQAALGRIEADVDSSARLQAEIRRLAERQESQDQRLAELKANVEQLAKREADVASIEASWEAAQVALTAAKRISDMRDEAAANLAAALADQTRIAAEYETASAPMEAARERVSIADGAVVSARASRDQAQDEARIRRADLSFRRDVKDLAQLEERKTRIDAALIALQSAEAVLSTNSVDEATLDEINRLHHAVEVARGRLGAREPLIEVEALGIVSGTLGGEAFRLAPGDHLERRVEGSLTLSVPKVITLTVKTSADADPTSAHIRSDETKLADLCRQVGAVDAADAESLHKERVEAERTRTEQRRILAENLQELTPEAIEGNLVTLRTRVDQFHATRGSTPQIAQDEATARTLAEEGDGSLAGVEQALAAAEHEADSARIRLSEHEVGALEAEVELRLAGEKAEQLRASLDSSRAETPDAILAQRLSEARSAAATVEERLRAARTDLEREDPEDVRQRFENADAAVATTARELRSAQDELLQVESRLRDHGEDGLAEELDLVMGTFAAAERNRDQYQSRALARKLLFETLADERESARRNYVAPLQQRIERLGSFLFGSDFAVELDNELHIVNRTMLNQTIPIDSLSVGAKEQLGLITRLACATIVAPDGGVPLILDDALGNSDPQRLEAMGAVLSVASRQTQIIIFTSQPDRYQQVGGATIVRLP